MSTFGTIKSRIADEMKRGELSASSTAVQRSVLSAIQHFQNQRFWFNEFRDSSISTTADDPYLSSMPSGVTIIKLDNVKITIGSRDYPLIKSTYQSLDNIDSGQWAGYPEYYAWYTKTLRLYPIPNAAYTVNMSGVRAIDDVSAGATAGATNEWVDDCEQMIRYRAKGILFCDELRNLQTGLQFYAKAEDERRQLNKRDRGYMGAGRVVATRF